MNQEAIKLWLGRRKTSGFAQRVLFGALALCAGIVVLFLTFWFTYAIIWFGWHGVTAISELIFSKKLHLSHGIRLVCSGVFVVLLFVQHFRTDPSHWGEYPDRNYPGLLPIAGGPMVGLGSLLAYPGASANMVADILLSGPRLVMGSGNLIAQGFRLKRLDQDGCAELLAFLYSRVGAVTYDELISAGWENWFGQLRYIDGVQFLQKGLLLSTELRGELDKLSGG